MHWVDRVYGEVSIEDPRLIALINTATFQRLRGIRQAGPSAFAYPFKTVTRFEHCLGVYLLLHRLGASLQEQVAGLLHDISHTAFSHAVDFLFSSDEQAHHEELKPEFLHRPDIVAALRAMGFAPEDFHDDSVYPLLERPLPWLCADRVDYFLRDGLTCGVANADFVRRFLENLVVIDKNLALTDPRLAQEAVELFAEMNRNWWASPTEAFIYNEFADALREGLRLSVLHKNDLFGDDAHVLACLRSAQSPLIEEKLDGIRHFKIEKLEGYLPKVLPKVRWLDPPVCSNGRCVPLSEFKSHTIHVSQESSEPERRAK